MFILFSMALAHAQMFSLQPLNRLSAGGSYADSSFGLGMSFESRLTQIIYVNIGAFRSLSEAEYEGDELRDKIKLRHGVWAAPGIRLPHRYKKSKNAINWDLFLRTGFGCFFNDLADKPDAFNMEPGALVGADLLLLWRDVGIRISGKSVFQNAYVSTEDQSLLLISPLLNIDFYSQFK